jgi:hypothetical protein
MADASRKPNRFSCFVTLNRRLNLSSTNNKSSFPKPSCSSRVRAAQRRDGQGRCRMWLWHFNAPEFVPWSIHIRASVLYRYREDVLIRFDFGILQRAEFEWTTETIRQHKLASKSRLSSSIRQKYSTGLFYSCKKQRTRLLLNSGVYSVFMAPTGISCDPL